MREGSYESEMKYNFILRLAYERADKLRRQDHEEGEETAMLSFGKDFFLLKGLKSLISRRTPAIFLLPALLLCFGTAPAGAIPASAVFRDAAPHKAFFVMEKYLPGPRKSVFSEGESLVFPGQGICWMVTKPRPQIWLITPAGIRDPDRYAVPESVRSAPPHPFFAKSMQAFMGLLSGNEAALESEYEIRVAPEGAPPDAAEGEAGASEGSSSGIPRIITLIPRDPGISRIVKEIAITAEQSRITGISIAEEGGGYTRITFGAAASGTAAAETLASASAADLPEKLSDHSLEALCHGR